MSFPQIFSGIKVLDFSRLLPGPFASELLIKMGAEVQCVLPPVGDPILGNYSPFASLRKGKKFMEVDLKDPEGKHRVLEMAGDCDILLEGFRPGALERLGLGFDRVCERNPNILYVSLNGYGPKDAKFLYGAHDLNFLVDSGVYSLLYPDASTDLPTLQLADLLGGLYAAFQILMEWIRRAKSPGAKHLQVSIVEGLSLFTQYLKDPGVEKLLPMLTGGVARYRIFTTKDRRRLVVAAIEPKFFGNLMKALSLPFDGHSDGEKVIEALAQRFSEKTLAEWEAELKTVDACLSFVPNRAEVLTQSKKASAT